MTNEQRTAIKTIIITLETFMNAAVSYPCPKGDKIIADIVRVQTYNKMLAVPISIINEMLND
jgi:hypothetical protein